VSQINLHVTPQFEKDLALLMGELQVRNKSHAIRIAVETMARYARKFAAIDARDAQQREAAERGVQCAAGGGAAAGAGGAAAAAAGAAEGAAAAPPGGAASE
jgi:hypothetical protein